jgi:putative hydrolase of the HAD superfamily
VNREPARIAGVVFDLFDTLVDLYSERLPPLEHRGSRIPGTAPALHRAFSRRVPDVDFDRFAEMLRRVDVEYRESRYARGLELRTDERFAAVLARLDVRDDALVAELTEVHMGALRSQVEVLDHHPGVLAALRAQVPLAVCSNFSHSETALRVLREAGLYEHLDVIVVSDEAGIRKPRPEIFRTVLDALGTAPGETLHVGDNLSADVGGASAVGLRTAWLTRRISDPEGRLRTHDGPVPDFTLRDLSELPALVAGLEPRASA